MHSGCHTVYSLLIFFFIINKIHAGYPQGRYFKRSNHIQDRQFYGNNYNEGYSNDDNNRMPLASEWDQMPLRNLEEENRNFISRRTPENFLEELDPNIVWDPKWASNLKPGQVSAVSIDPEGNVGVFHRGSRVWDGGSFDGNERFNCKDNNGPIRENTIILLDRAGNPILQWGKNMFYMPHGLTIDHLGNYWITDVALHQVFKFNADDIEKNRDLLMRDNIPEGNFDRLCPDSKDLFKYSILKPSLILGTAFVPGNDEESFCKPTAVAVMMNGDFFVSDGYCNSRIVKFNARGERILTWGRNSRENDLHPSPYTFSIPHALALAEEFGYLFVADRENGRVLCFHALNGTFHKEYKADIIGGAIYSIAYANEKLYLVNGPDMTDTPVRGFILDVNTNKIISQFAPNEAMARPHDIAVTPNGHEIYVVELDSKRVSKFIQGSNSSSLQLSSDSKASGSSKTDFESSPFTDDTEKGFAKSSSFAFSLIVSMFVLIILCLILAVVVSRRQKRGRSIRVGDETIEFSQLMQDNDDD